MARHLLPPRRSPQQHRQTPVTRPIESPLSPRRKARSCRHPERSEGSRGIRHPQTRSTLTTLKNGGVASRGTLKNGGVECCGTLRMEAANGVHLLPLDDLRKTPASSSNPPRRKARSCCHPERSEGSREIRHPQTRSTLTHPQERRRRIARHPQERRRRVARYPQNGVVESRGTLRMAAANGGTFYPLADLCKNTGKLLYLPPIESPLLPSS